MHSLTADTPAKVEVLEKDVECQGNAFGLRMVHRGFMMQGAWKQRQICQAGMYSVAYGRLAAAVSKAGGLGVIGSAFMDAEQLRREIRLVKEETDKPFGIDILFAETRGTDAATATYTKEVEEHIEVTFEEGVPVIVSGLGNPSRIVGRAHDAGMVVMSLVGTSCQALKVEASGVDVVIASGHEGGGHVGRVGTLPLVSKVVDLVKIPVLARAAFPTGARSPPPLPWARRAC